MLIGPSLLCRAELETGARSRRNGETDSVRREDALSRPVYHGPTPRNEGRGRREDRRARRVELREGHHEEASREERAEEETGMTRTGFDDGAASVPSGPAEGGSMEKRQRHVLVASERLRHALEARGVTEQDIQRDFEAWREGRRRSRATSGGSGTSAPSGS